MAKTWELSDSEWQDVIDVNLTGVWRTVKATVPAMIAGRRGGSIVLTSSLAGLKGYSNIAGYVAAKHRLQEIVRESMEGMTGAAHAADHCGTDGCSIPTMVRCCSTGLPSPGSNSQRYEQR